MSMRAGLLRLDGRTLTADPRRGTLQVVMPRPRLVWVADGARDAEFAVDLSSGAVALQMLPGPQRALCVRKDNTPQQYLWLQEPESSPEADTRRTADFNALIERLRAAASQESAVPTFTPQQQQQQPRSRTAQAYLDLIEASARGTEHTAAPLPSQGSLRDYFSMVLENQAQIEERERQAEPEVDLEELLKPDSLWELIKEDEDLQQEMYPYMPEDTRNLEGLRELVYSAQFRQTVQTLAIVLHNGDAPPLLAEMHLPLDAQGPHGGAFRFLLALIDQYDDGGEDDGEDVGEDEDEEE